MITGSEPAMPTEVSMDTEDKFSGYHQVGNTTALFHGLTFRQYFAGLAMQGMLSACQGFDNRGLDNLAKCAVQQADALINELNKTFHRIDGIKSKGLVFTRPTL